MKVNGQACRTIEAAPLNDAVIVIDQRFLPHRFSRARLTSVAEVRTAIVEMWVRGAPLIGVTAAYGIALQCRVDSSDDGLRQAKAWLDAARPTAVNLSWATHRMVEQLLATPRCDRVGAAWDLAVRMADDDVNVNEAIGRHGMHRLAGLSQKCGARPLQILTHCNAGWLATVDWGTALSPIYQAHRAGIALHVWVDETRPRNQGASLTAWELGQEGVPHTVIADNAGGHLMQHGQVDLVIVGADRVTSRGDVCNKIGTYLKALAAADNRVPFYAAVPRSTVDLSVHDGLAEIEIEMRSPREQSHVTGLDAAGNLTEVLVMPAGSPALNPAFDVTPARLVTGIITERGVVAPADVARQS